MSNIILREQGQVARQQPSMGVVPRSLADLEQLARACLASGFFKDAQQLAQAMIKIQAGAELGIPPVQALTTINIIKDRITLSAGLMAALLKRAGYKIRVRWSDDPLCCTIAVHEGGEVVGESSFSTVDAKKAQLSGASWQKYTRNMLYARAISNAARWYAPEVLTGCYLPEELEESPTAPTPVRPTPQPTIEPAPLPADPDAYPAEGWQRANRRLRAVMREVGVSVEEVKACMDWFHSSESSKTLSAHQLRDIADALESAPTGDVLANDISQFYTLLADSPSDTDALEIRTDHCPTPWRLIALERALFGGGEA